MSLNNFDLVILDEKAMLEHRLSVFDKWMNPNPITNPNEDENETDAEEVSILNLPSLKRGKT